MVLAAPVRRCLLLDGSSNMEVHLRVHLLHESMLGSEL